MKKIVIGAILSTSLLLSACSLGTTTQDLLANSLAKVYEEEQGYRDAQKQLAELEKKEQSTFKSVMELTQEQLEEVTKKVNDLNASLDERLVLLEEENESIQGAHSALTTFDELVEDVKDEEVKASLKSLKTIMEARYEAHEVVYSEYQKLTTLQSEFYEMMSNEKTEQNKLQEQVAKVNKQNELVQSAISEFNEATKTVNETKTSVFDSLTEEK